MVLEDQRLGDQRDQPLQPHFDRDLKCKQRAALVHDGPRLFKTYAKAASHPANRASCPVKGLLPQHRVSAGLVLPVIVLPAQHQPLLGPEDLAADIESSGEQPVGHGRRMPRAVPEVSYVAGKQRPGCSTVRAVIVHHLVGAVAPCQ